MNESFGGSQTGDDNRGEDDYVLARGSREGKWGINSRRAAEQSLNGSIVGIDRAARGRGFVLLFSYYVATVVGLYVIGEQNEFVAFFGTFAIAGAAGVLSFSILLCARLIRSIRGRFRTSQGRRSAVPLD